MAEEILIASDHAGFELKEKLEAELKRLGFAVRDLGTDSPQSSDYADYAHPLAREISDGRARRGVLLCGTGLGMSYVANRYPHVRGAVSWSPEIAELSRRHNDSNVLIIPARFVTEADARKILQAWLDAPFEGGRHERRVVKIDSAGSAKPTSQAEGPQPRAHSREPKAKSPEPKAESAKPKA